MATFTVSTEDKKSEKVLKAFFDALELDYNVEDNQDSTKKIRPLNKQEKRIFKSLKGSLIDIRKWERGEIKLKNAEDFLNEL